MARTPKPWFREDRGYWAVTIDGKRHNLGTDEVEAKRHFHELMARKPARDSVPDSVPALAGSAAATFDAFLAWTKCERAARTFEFYRDRLQLFLDAAPKRLAMASLSQAHVDKLFDAHPTWSSGYRAGIVQALIRACNWAVKRGDLVKSPLAALEKPAKGVRDNPVTEADYALILRNLPDGPFKDVVMVAWETGARPQEIRALDAANVQQDCWQFHYVDSKGKKYPRTVCLSKTARELTAKHNAEHPEGPVFRNEDGRPWTSDAFNCAMTRLRTRLKKQGIGKSWAFYDLRHGFAHRMLRANKNPAIIAELMGHRDLQMFYNVYGHVMKAKDHLREALE